MRLGIVEMMPGDFRTWTKDHTRAVHDLGFTGFGFHLDGETAFEITLDDCRRYHEFMAGEGLDLAQFAILYKECLFSPDPAERETVTRKINRGTGLPVPLIENGHINLREGIYNERQESSVGDYQHGAYF